MAYIGVSPSNGVRQKHTYTATASQTTFSGAGSEGVSLSYRDSNYVDVYVNGVKLGDADYTATSGTSIVLAVGAAVNDIVEIITYDVFSVADTVSKADGGTFDGNVAMAGTLDVTGDLTVDTSTLYVDSTNNNIGIGTTSPTAFANYTTVAINGTTGSIIDLQHGGTINSRVVGESAGLLLDGVGSRFIKFHTNSTERMRINSSGNVGIGTSSPQRYLDITTGTNEDYQFRLGRTTTNSYDIGRNYADGLLYFYGNQTNYNGYVFDGVDGERMRIDSSGNVGIGTSSPTAKVDLVDDGVQLRLANSTTGTTTSDGSRFQLSGNDLLLINRESANIQLYTADTERMRIDANGSITTTASSGNMASFSSSTNAVEFKILSPTANVVRLDTGTSDVLAFAPAGTERVRIDSSGNLLVGKSSTDFNTEGMVISPTFVNLTRDGNQPLSLNRLNSDGNILVFYRDGGSAVGSIASDSGSILLGSGDVGVYFDASSDRILPMNMSTLSVRNDAIDIGGNPHRFKDLYLSGGVYLGGTGSANLLSDYEEGSFTLSLPNVTIGNGTATGLYTKIGSLVMVQIIFIMGSTTSITGTFYVDNLPFTVTTTLADHYGLTGNLLNSGVDNFMAYGRAKDGTTQGYVYYPQNASAGSANPSRGVNATSPFTWGANDKIECGFMYYTDA